MASTRFLSAIPSSPSPAETPMGNDTSRGFDGLRENDGEPPAPTVYDHSQSLSPCSK